MKKSTTTPAEPKDERKAEGAKLLNKLTKDDLITVISNMHDAVLNWNGGHGFSEKDGDNLNRIGSACCSCDAGDSRIGKPIPDVSKL